MDFPKSAFPSDSRRDRGMSLRDYFAAKAMQGLLAADAHGAMASASPQTASWAYDQADAMLAARAK